MLNLVEYLINDIQNLNFGFSLIFDIRHLNLNAGFSLIVDIRYSKVDIQHSTFECWIQFDIGKSTLKFEILNLV